MAKIMKTFVIIGLVLLFVAVLGSMNHYYSHLPENISQHETIVLGSNQFNPGSEAALRVLVRDSRDAQPLSGATVRISLRPAQGGQPLEVFSGETNSSGTADVAFLIPEDLDPEQALIVETRSRLGQDTFEQAVSIQRDYRVLLSTDKPIYQPGQVIHLRMLALSAFDLAPATGQVMEIVIADGKGNKVFRQEVQTNDFGVAALDFQLADEVNTGAYKISAGLKTSRQTVTSEKTVAVEHYVLPKFDVELKTGQNYYLPGERVEGTLNATYFFGKPVAGGQVLLEGYTFDVERTVVFSLQGTTSDLGDFSFTFDLPPYLAGSSLEGGMGRFYLQATVTDLAQHSQVAQLSLPVSQSAIQIDAIPEGGMVHPGVENILYVLTSYPDGAPAQSQLEIQLSDTGQRLAVDSGAFGLAEVRFVPTTSWLTVNIQASDLQGNQGTKDFSFEGEFKEESVLLRPEKPVYRVGETLNLTVLTSQASGTVFLDIIREGQTISTRSLEITGGQGELAVDLSPDLSGTLELHAYKINPSGTMIRDTRLVVVDRAEDLLVSIAPGQDIYRPGEEGMLNVQVSGQDGLGVHSALGLAVVDEAVFALAEQDPGFAKLYFLLEREILQPRFDLHGYSVPVLLQETPAADPATLQAVEGAAQASLAAAIGVGRTFGMQANSHQIAMQRAYDLQERYFNGLSTGIFILLCILAVTILGVSLYSLKKEKTLVCSLLLVAAFLIGAVGLFLFWPLGIDSQWVRTPVDRLSFFFSRIFQGNAEILIGLFLIGLLSFLGLVVTALRRKYWSLAWNLGLFMAFIAGIGLFVYAASRADLNPDENVIWAGILAFALIPLAFLLRSASYAWRGQFLVAAATLVVAVAALLSPLPGLALASRVGSQALAGNGIRGDGIFVEEELVVAPVQAPGAGLDGVEKSTTSENAASAEAPRLRQYFPETMLWLPDLVTGEDGALALDILMADSITTWRITALASSQDGRLGSTTASLRVFQDFFIDLDLPLALTVGDEIAVPVGVFNYLAEAQDVRLELEQQSWFELLDDPVKNISIAPNDIQVVYFRVRALDFGMQSFQVTAWGSRMSDAIRREVRVYPDGKPLTFTRSDRIEPGNPVVENISIPEDAIPGSQNLIVKVYPGILSQVVEGLDSLLRMPNGCFEQTSSTTYPNVLVLDYLKRTDQISPETQLKAEEYINLGYQRLTTFEVGSTGGFSLFGNEPADRMLTAYGLQEFADMSRVYDVDPALIDRAAAWLFQQQAGDGSWENDQGLVHENTWSSLGNDRLPVTAYIAWSLVEAGYGSKEGTQKGLAYVREHQTGESDPYVIALVANALVAADLADDGGLAPVTLAVLDRLAALAVQDSNGVYWASSVATFMGSEGQTGSIETTALAALALLRSETHPDLGNSALTYLIRQKDSYGTWYSTQSTVLTLKALLQSISGGENTDATLQVRLNGGQERVVLVNADNFDVVQLLSFSDVLPGENRVEITAEGQGNLMYQVSGSYYLPWDKLPLYPDILQAQELASIEVRYDRTELAVNDTVAVQVTVRLNQPGSSAESALIDLGLPPGFSVQAEDIQALVAYFRDLPEDKPGARIQRYELTGRQILVYVTGLKEGESLQFTYHLRAQFPLFAQTPASSAYDYYNPDITGESQPQILTVTP